jgi:hypothetical protein
MKSSKKDLRFALVFIFLVPLFLILLSMPFKFAFFDEPIMGRILRGAVFDRTPLLVFGDSVLTHTGSCETPAPDIGAQLEATLNRRITLIAENAFTATDFAQYAELISTLGMQPKMAIIEVNLTTFSRTFFLENSVRRSRRKGYITLASGDFSAAAEIIRKDILASVKTRASTAATSDTPQNTDPGFPKIESRGETRIPLSLECLSEHQRLAEYEPTVANRFLKNYGHLIYPSNEVLESLVGLIKTLRSNGTDRILLIFSPVDYQRARELVGEQIMNSITHNISLIMSHTNYDGISYLDLTYSADHVDFIDRGCACGHLGRDARNYFTNKILQYLGEIGVM